MLSVILGFSELAMEKTAPDDPLYDDLKEIVNAGRRSTEITRQLLAFSRRQTIDPIVLDLNDTVEGMLKMLRRLIGEDIDLAWQPGHNLWPISMDPTQIDQILANLCVNARDAIADTGKLTIETHNTSLDDDYCADRAGFTAGEYVMLAISDDGCGMDRTILDNLFEPFFTTKEVGKGTGLGLATVYGIVKQNDGYINVYSEPGKGTTFKIYLPRHAGPAVADQLHCSVQSPTGHGEVILLVEDDAAVLKLTERLLTDIGYTVLAAGTPQKALALADAHNGAIALLMTDVIMPGMNGRELVDHITARYPGIKTLFMSGYTADVIAHRGVLDDGVNFIHKPFSRQALAVKIRQTVESSPFPSGKSNFSATLKRCSQSTAAPWLTTGTAARLCPAA
jgi:CheY-like chemotaxis protein